MLDKHSWCYMADRVLYNGQSMVHRVLYGLQSVEWWTEDCMVDKHSWCNIADIVLHGGQSMVYNGGFFYGLQSVE